jgi:hypothetical protein
VFPPPLGTGLVISVAVMPPSGLKAFNEIQRSACRNDGVVESDFIPLDTYRHPFLAKHNQVTLYVEMTK